MILIIVILFLASLGVLIMFPPDDGAIERHRSNAWRDDIDEEDLS